MRAGQCIKKIRNNIPPDRGVKGTEICNRRVKPRNFRNINMNMVARTKRLDLNPNELKNINSNFIYILMIFFE